MRHTAPLAALLLVCAFAVVLMGACARVTPPPPRITMSPAADAVSAPPDKGLVVTAGGGRLTSVLAFAGREPVPGAFDASHTSWRSAWTLRPGTEYVVNAAAVGREGVAARLAGRFRTLRPAHGLGIGSVAPYDGETVGVGMPIIVTFTGHVQDRAAVERALEVRAGVEGAWHWAGDSRVVYRTRKLWPARHRVVFAAHLAGVRAGPGTYGTADRTVSFTVGRAMVSTVDTLTHQMVVRQDGEVVQRMPISAGMATTTEYTTTSGIHLTMDKGNPVRMISPGRDKGDPGYYDVMIGYAVRISNSGEYVHAKDNIWAQGRANVSHGCVNARPDQARWFYEHALRGDPVIVTGTDRKLEWTNGWGYWQLPWADWLKGSALANQS
ncbi:Ig-like domain-containing protein [Planotetraspora sp. A-T 1434]|uniref:L,D-transpeptidase n=1 Tax=Planotetraspora sp. A-T 1434 TaxID=2979219 RepID=UPI0021C1F65B|nr:Ig-like domain-containing protein [Planotetraspora sp. A-T 1434]MCT9933269.1 Ig-like domain-containing protein [Planotetraspora sp. A-T 1434]